LITLRIVLLLCAANYAPLSALSDERHAELAGAFCRESYGDRAYLGLHDDQNVSAGFV
jgi:hypothetical protein